MGVIGARTPASWSHPRSGAPRPDNTSRSGNLNGNPSIPLPTPDRCRAIPCHSDRHDDGHGTLPAARRRSPRFPGDGADRTTAGRSNTSSFHDPLLGPHDKAVQRRMRHDPFVQAVSRLRRERVEGMSTKLVDASAEAVDTLAELLHSAGRPSDRKLAASVLLGQASRSHGITVEHETRHRLERLESQLHAPGDHSQERSRAPSPLACAASRSRSTPGPPPAAQAKHRRLSHSKGTSTASSRRGRFCSSQPSAPAHRASRSGSFPPPPGPHLDPSRWATPSRAAPPVGLGPVPGTGRRMGPLSRPLRRRPGGCPEDRDGLSLGDRLRAPEAALIFRGSRDAR